MPIRTVKPTVELLETRNAPGCLSEPWYFDIDPEFPDVQEQVDDFVVRLDTDGCDFNSSVSEQFVQGAEQVAAEADLLALETAPACWEGYPDECVAAEELWFQLTAELVSVAPTEPPTPEQLRANLTELEIAKTNEANAWRERLRELKQEYINVLLIGAPIEDLSFVIEDIFQASEQLKAVKQSLTELDNVQQKPNDELLGATLQLQQTKLNSAVSTLAAYRTAKDKLNQVFANGTPADVAAAALDLSKAANAYGKAVGEYTELANLMKAN